MPGLCPGVADAEGPAALIEGPFELRPPVGEHPRKGPAGLPVERH